MPFYRVCPCCGAYLDPGERCDCQDEKKAALGVTSTQGGRVESELQRPRSAPIVPAEKEAVNENHHFFFTA